MNLRKPIPADLDFMVSIEHDPENKHFTHFEIIPSRADIKRLIHKEFDLSVDGQCRFVLQTGDKQAALVDLYDVDIAKASAWIGIIVEKTFRKQGIGSKCLQLIEKEAFDVGIMYLYASVHSLNFPALALFRSLSYKPIRNDIRQEYLVLSKDIH